MPVPLAEMTTSFARRLSLNRLRVHRAARGLLRNEEEASEVAQEALTRAWAARDRYDEKRPFYPWLYTIVRNACRDAAARRRHRAVSGLDSERLAGSDPGPLAKLSQKEAQEQVRAAMTRLSPAHRDILTMRHFEDLSYAEIAQILEVAEGTVMSRIYRARKALLEAMKEGGE